MKYFVEICPGEETCACTADIVALFEVFVSVDGYLVCSGEHTHHVIFWQVNGVLEDEPDEEDDADIPGQKVLIDCMV